MSSSRPPIRFTLRQLQYFAAVARTGQISLAAAEANVTQSAMTAAIAELERVVGTLLFERSRSGATLTYEGNLFLQHAQAVLEAATDAARYPFRDRSTVAGSLEVAATSTVLGYFLLPLVAKFQKLFPDAHIEPVERDRKDIEAGLEAGDIELAVALISNLQDPRHFQRRVLARSRRQLWVAANHPLAKLNHASLEDVAPYPYVLPTVDDTDSVGMRFWSEAGLQPVMYRRTTSVEAVREMIALGMGVTILSDMVFRPWSLDGRRIHTVPLKDPIPPMEIGILWRKGHRLGLVASAFYKYLEVTVAMLGTE